MKNTGLIIELLRLKRPPPLAPRDMARELAVTFFPPHQKTPRLDAFTGRLRAVFEKLGVSVIPFEEALISDADKRVRPGISIIEQGEGPTGNLAVHFVTSLYDNPVIGIYDGPSPVDEHETLQEVLDSVVAVLAWNMIHTPIFVEDDRWTICTMNGSVIRCGGPEQMQSDVLGSLVPKLAGQVVPPKNADIIYREGAFDVEKEGYVRLVDDYRKSASMWRSNGLMLAHTSLDSLRTRNRFYKRLVSVFLDHRTGMSYGFMVRQLPTTVKPAVRREAAAPELRDHNWSESSTLRQGDGLYGIVRLRGIEWIVEIPDVWLLATRSGCDKTNLDPHRDILKMGFSSGRLVVNTPVGMKASHCRPSYDTFVMIAHAVGNAIVASVLAAEQPQSDFPRTLAGEGLSMSHWHGYPFDGVVPEGYVLYGNDNPPVSCSTPQSAVYAFAGKMETLEETLRTGRDYRGDVHVEPHHGTNITGHLSLAETAAWVDEQHRKAQAAGEPVNAAYS